MGFFCEECGAVLDRGNCMNSGCSQSKIHSENEIVEKPFIDQSLPNDAITQGKIEIEQEKHTTRFCGETLGLCSTGYFHMDDTRN